RPHELVLQGLDQIRHHAAFAGLNESLDRHAWDELDLAEPRDLAFRHGNTGVVVRLTGALVGRGVGGNARDRAVDFRRCAQIERRETQHCRLTNLNLVDVARIDLGLDLQVVRFRNDQHDGVTSRDDSAYSVHFRLEHDAILWCANVDALELVLRRDLALDELAIFGVDLAHVLSDLAAQILINLDDLQFGLGNLALGLRNCGEQLRPLAFKPRGVAFERGQPRDLHEVVFPELAHPVELLADQAYFASLGVLLGIQPADFVLQLGDPLFQLCFLPEPGVAAQLEQLALIGERNGDGGFVGVSEQHARERYRFDAITFGFETSLSRSELV